MPTPHFYIFFRFLGSCTSPFSENNLLYAIEMTYTTVGVKLERMACYGARFVVLKHPLTFLREWLSRLNVGKGSKISPRQTRRNIIQYYTLLFSPRNPQIICYSLRDDASSAPLVSYLIGSINWGKSSPVVRDAHANPLEVVTLPAHIMVSTKHPYITLHIYNCQTDHTHYSSQVKIF